MNCDWVQDGVDRLGRKIFRCQRQGCRNALFAESSALCHAECRQPCRYLGKVVNSIKVQCESCNGRVMIKYDANVCDLYGRCLPTYKPPDLDVWLERKPESDIYRLCNGCEGFELV